MAKRTKRKNRSKILKFKTRLKGLSCMLITKIPQNMSWKYCHYSFSSFVTFAILMKRGSTTHRSPSANHLATFSPLGNSDHSANNGSDDSGNRGDSEMVMTATTAATAATTVTLDIDVEKVPVVTVVNVVVTAATTETVVNRTVTAVTDAATAMPSFSI